VPFRRIDSLAVLQRQEHGCQWRWRDGRHSGTAKSPRSLRQGASGTMMLLSAPGRRQWALPHQAPQPDFESNASHKSQRHSSQDDEPTGLPRHRSTARCPTARAVHGAVVLCWHFGVGHVRHPPHRACWLHQHLHDVRWASRRRAEHYRSLPTCSSRASRATEVVRSTVSTLLAAFASIPVLLTPI
jgi:hypothetical protein